MRAIKFRAWSKDHQIMMLPINQYGNKEPDTGLKTSSAGAFTRLWEALARFRDNNDFILMQYTGLKDKNGVEIYEGDIVNYHTTTGPPMLAVMTFDEDQSRFGLVEPGESTLWGIHKFHVRQRLEVIGNIYEAPELATGFNYNNQTSDS